MVCYAFLQEAESLVFARLLDLVDLDIVLGIDLPAFVELPTLV